MRFLTIGWMFFCGAALAFAPNVLAFAEDTMASPTAASTQPSVDPTQEWGPTAAPYLSLANQSPILLKALNDAQPVFGLPGTIAGPDVTKNTQFTGDWAGWRTKMTDDGLFIDFYSSSALQSVGRGMQASTIFVQTGHLAVNIDSGRAGFWPGGLFHIAAQTRFGSSATNQLGGGGSVPSWTQYGNPTVGANGFLPTEYHIVQQITPFLTTIMGKIDSVYLPDQTIFGSSGKSDWISFNFSGANPLLLNVYSNTSWAFLGALNINKDITVIGGVLDPNSKATNFANNAFNGVNLYAQVMFSVDLDNRPGLFMPIFNWSSKKLIDYDNPIKNLPVLLDGMAKQGAISAVATRGIDSNPTSDFVEGLMYAQPNTRRSSWMLLGNFSQYLYVLDDPAVTAQKMKTGQLVRGFGLQGRIGYGPSQTNFVSRHISLGLYGAGLADSRPLDRYGIGFYFNGISHNFRDNFSNVVGRGISDEKGMEAFYNYAITPAVSLTSSYQYIWDPTYAQIVSNRKQASVFLERLSIVW